MHALVLSPSQIILSVGLEAVLGASKCNLLFIFTARVVALKGLIEGFVQLLHFSFLNILRDLIVKSFLAHII